MGGRGAFVNVNTGDFRFVENGQKYHSVGEVDGIKILVQSSGSVSAPFYSHTANRMYATIQKGELKYITKYDDNHNKMYSIDLLHNHNGLRPHKHLGNDHTTAYKLSDDEIKIVNKIRREFNLK